MSQKPDSKSVLLAGASAIVMSFLGAAHAQGEPTAAEAETLADSRRLSTVTVTAQQRVESIQDVPIAITALDPEQLERAGIADIKNLDQVAPSFNLNTSDTQSGGVTLRIRGVGTTGNNVGLESSVGVFLDGVYLSRPGIALSDLLDLEQLEILRGPQGTLFGRNTSAGALNIRSRAPNLSEYESFANLTVGNYGLYNVQAGVNLPVISDKLAVRLSGAIRERDGFVKGLNGSESGTVDKIVLRGQALADFGSNGTLRLIVDYAEADENCCDAVWHNDTSRAAAFALSPTLGPTGGVFSVPGPGLNDYRSNSENFFERNESFGFSAQYDVDLPFGELTYIGSYRDFDGNSARNTDFVGIDVFTVGASPEALALPGTKYDPNGGAGIESITHEVRLQGTAFDDRLSWLAGAYYSDEEIYARGSLTMLDGAQQAADLGILGGQLLPLGLSFRGIAGGVSTEGDFQPNLFEQSGQSFSLFTHNVFAVTDRLDLTVGLRYVDESKDGSFRQLAGGQANACNSFFGTVAAGVVPAIPLGDVIQFDELATIINCFVFAAPAYDPANPTAAQATVAAGPQAYLLDFLPQEFNDTFEDDELVYTLNATYALTPTTKVYASYTHGFKSGGFNLDASAAAGGGDPRFDSEKLDSLEFGLKADLLDGRARANIAVFFQEMEDFQVLEFTGTKFETFNVDKAESRGVEFEGLAQIDEHFTASLGVTYTDAKYPDDCTSLDASSPTFQKEAVTLCGQPLTNAPEWVGILGGTFEHPVFNGAMNFFAAGSVRYETERRTSTQAVEAITSLQVRNLLAATNGSPSIADVEALRDRQPALPGDIQEANTKVNLRVGLQSENGRWAIELWGNNILDERTKNVTFNIPLRGGYGDRARGQFVQDPATYGVTLRTKF